MSANLQRQAPVAPRHLPDKGNVQVQMWLRLLACSNLVTAYLRRRLRREFDISLPTFDILAQIARPPLSPTMGELSKRLMVSKGSVTDLIERLTEQGLVTRRGDSRDARVQRVCLTARGKRLLDRTLPAHNDYIRALMAGLGSAAIAQLSTQLGELRGVLRNVDAPQRPARPRPQRFAGNEPSRTAITTSSKLRRMEP